MTGGKVTGARAVKIRLLLKIIFLFAGTFLHELTHYVAALVFGTPAGFSVFPRISGDSLIFGSVKAKTKFRVLSSFIAIAPLIWWLILYLVLFHYRAARHLYLGRSSSYVALIVYLWLGIQLLWAGRLSSQDVRTFFSGLFSFSGLFLILTIAALFFGAYHFHLRLHW
jgi:hypothetical protein